MRRAAVLLLLPLAYLVQLPPHAHADHGPTAPGEAAHRPGAHAAASHTHDDHHHGAPAGHHHELTRHLDSHFPRPDDEDALAPPAAGALVVGVPSTPAAGGSTAPVAAAAGRSPQSRPVPTAAPRAPPRVS